MKLRIKGNSVRLRLSKTEVNNFGIEGVVEEKTSFPFQEFHYALRVDPMTEHLHASFAGNTLTVWMSESIREQWVNTDEVGFQHKMPLPDGNELFILIEKDFVCLDNTFEDQSDNYPNPNAVC